MKRKVAVLGASLPGLIVAKALADRGHSVTLFGDPSKARTANPVGPMYLWDSPEVRRYMADLGCPYGDRQTVERRVMWITGDGLLRPHGPGEDDVEGYMVKAGTRSRAVCGGHERFRTVNGGLELLRVALLPRLWESGVRLVKDDVTGLLDLEAIVDYPLQVEWADGGRDMFECVYNTLPRHVFERLCLEKCETTTQVTYFHRCLRPPFPERSLCDETLSALFYCGDPKVRWFRCTWAGLRDGNRWTYEAREPLHGYGEVTAVEAKLVHTPSLPERDWAFHVGRWAEMDAELMVSDVIARLDEYVDKIS